MTDIISPYWGYIEFFTSLIFSGFALSRVLNFLRTYSSTKSRINQKQSENQLLNPFARFNSFGEMAVNIANGLDLQAQEIAKNCEKAGKDPMQDTGYMTVVKDHQRALSYADKFQRNPAYMVLDNVGYPIVKNLGVDAIKMIQRWMKTA